MKAYTNSKGHIMAVFKDSDGDYAVYTRKEQKGFFKRTTTKYPARATRSEAEQDMEDIIWSVPDKTWQKFEFRGQV